MDKFSSLGSVSSFIRMASVQDVNLELAHHKTDDLTTVPPRPYKHNKALQGNDMFSWITYY